MFLRRVALSLFKKKDLNKTNQAYSFTTMHKVKFHLSFFLRFQSFSQQKFYEKFSDWVGHF